MKLSARNLLPGKVVEIRRGATTSHVRIAIAGTVLYFAGNPSHPRFQEAKLADARRALRLFSSLAFKGNGPASTTAVGSG